VTGGWRCFVAVPIGAALRADMAAAVDDWRRRPDTQRLSWTDPDAWHLTLAFLGAIAPERVPALARVLDRQMRRVPSFTVRTSGVGAFPRARRARVAWYGVADPLARLSSLAAAVRTDLGIEDGAPFRAHITLARARDETGVDLRRWVSEAAPPSGSIDVDRIDLMRSHLGRGPARYELLASAVLPSFVHA